MRDSTDPTSCRTDGFAPLSGLLGPLPAAPNCAFGLVAGGGEPSVTPPSPVAGCSPGSAPTFEDGPPSKLPDGPGTAAAGGFGPPPGCTPAPAMGLSTLPRIMG